MATLDAVHIQNVSKDYKIGEDRIPILSDFNLRIKSNEFVILSGPSGSGKTTILNIIGGLSRVDTGEIRILNHDIKNMTEEELAIFRSVFIGFVFQNGHLINSLTIRENIMLPFELNERNKVDSTYQTRCLALMKEFRIDHRSESLPLLVSGGEYQRTVFVRALLMDPDLLLIDEPTSNQDPLTTDQIISKLRLLKRKKTVIVVTHDRKIFPLADRIYLPQNGKLINFAES